MTNSRLTQLTTEPHVNIEHYKKRLVDMEKDLSARIRRETALGRDQTADSPQDSGDSGEADEAASEDFSEAGLDSDLLQQVRDALKRIDDGTFGMCIVDGQPIEEKRLEASPWTPYCLKHQALLDAQAGGTMPTM
jgi:DnaK suppressor protein